MKAIVENWSLVLLGAWNTAIVTPDWLTKHAGLSGQVQIEFPVGNPLLPIRYTLPQGIRLVALQDRLILAPQTVTDEDLAAVEGLARKVLEILTHTPVTAIGVNFEFAEDNPPEDLKSLFKVADSSRLAAADFVVEGSEIRRRLRQGADVALNLALRQVGAPLTTVMLNFHRDVDSAQTAAAYLSGRFVKYRDLAVRLLRDVYQLQLEESP